MMRGIDPILTSIIANSLDSITKEMGETMLRTSRSPIFSEARDFTTAIFDHRLRMVAQTAYIPVQMGAIPFAIKAIHETFEKEIYEGDVFILNDPYRGNNHPPDITIAKPVFYGGKLLFWAISKGHHADVGGGGVAGYNPVAKNVWEEAIRIPSSKLYEKGVYNRDLWNMILINVHIPFLVEGDLHCQVGAVTIGERSIRGLIDKYGVETLERAVEEILIASEKRMRKEIEQIPDGVYKAERMIDQDGIQKDRMITVKVAITVENDSITFDYTGTDGQVQGFLNSPLPNTYSSTYLALFSCVDPSIKVNEGSIKPIKIIAPEGSLLNPREPAPTTACTVPTCEAITEACWIALSQAIPERVQAPWGRWCGPNTTGFNPRTQRPFAEIHFMGKGGAGATHGFDGWDHLGTVVCMGGLRSPDPELHEMVNPYIILEYEYLQDSAGPGEWRGGCGVRYRWKVLGDDIICVNFGSGATEATAPVSLLGGKPAPRNRGYIKRVDGTSIETEANNFYTLKKGDIFEIYSSGGGGFGNPFQRSIEKVLEDVRNGIVSAEKAKEDYGVVIDPRTLQVNMEETEKIRGSIPFQS